MPPDHHTPVKSGRLPPAEQGVDRPLDRNEITSPSSIAWKRRIYSALYMLKEIFESAPGHSRSRGRCIVGLRLSR